MEKLSLHNSLKAFVCGAFEMETQLNLISLLQHLFFWLCACLFKSFFAARLRARKKCLNWF